MILSWITLLLFCYTFQSMAQIVSPSSPSVISEEYVHKLKHDIAELQEQAAHLSIKEPSMDEYKDHEVKKYPHDFDFIIVGGGTSGSVLASRLSEIPEYKILLVESGGFPNEVMRIPAVHKVLAQINQWGYTTIPQKTWCLETNECSLPTSKVFGGSSSTDDMVYTRGNHRDYDLWADEDNVEWCWNHVKPYFMKIENAKLEKFDRKFHKQGGYQTIEDEHHLDNVTKEFLEVVHEKFGQKIIDYNGKDQLGFAPIHSMTKLGKRQSTFDSYLHESLHRKNLKVIKNAQVLEILISAHTKQATGIKVLNLEDGSVTIIKSSKEVIVSAGGLNSAKLLLLSGVGPHKHLEDLKIEVVQDLPVGETLKDHPLYELNYKNPEHKSKLADNTLMEYLMESKGPLTIGELQALGFAKTQNSKEPAEYPDVQISFKVTKELVKIGVSLMHPKSSGKLLLKSSDPLSFPLVDLNFYSDEEEEDLHTMKEGILIAKKIADAMHLEPIHDKADCPDDDLECKIKHYTKSQGDFTHTCKMGKYPVDSVVDPKLRVHGISKLRVVDAAVIPVSITGSVRAAGILIGEKGADSILEAWK